MNRATNDLSRSRLLLPAICAALIAGGTILAPSPAHAVEYRFCVACDNYAAQALVSSGTPDFGKEWYRVKTAMMFAKAHQSQSCGASDFSPTKCGHLPEEKLLFLSVDGDQINGLLSGNPVVIGQSAIEIVTGIPAIIFKWVKSWF